MATYNAALDNTASAATATAESGMPSSSTAILVPPAALLATADRLLREHVDHLAQRRDSELAQANLRMPQRKVLESLKNHGAGLTVFVNHPEVPLDNNEAERRERGPVVGRKNYYCFVTAKESGSRFGVPSERGGVH